MHLLEVWGERARLRSTGRGIVPPRPALCPDPALRLGDGSCCCCCTDATPVVPDEGAGEDNDARQQ